MGLVHGRAPSHRLLWPCRSLRSALAAAAFAVAGLATLALAHEGATGVVKERMDLMKRQQKDMKLIGDMARGKQLFDAMKASEAARDLAITSKRISDLFPAGSNGHPSDAKDEIWQSWDDFTAHASDLGERADALAASLGGSGDKDWKGAFQKMTDACKSCHKTFRAESEHADH
jgi:cytochrome c556